MFGLYCRRGVHVWYRARYCIGSFTFFVLRSILQYTLLYALDVDGADSSPTGYLIPKIPSLFRRSLGGQYIHTVHTNNRHFTLTHSTRLVSVSALLLLSFCCCGCGGGCEQTIHCIGVESLCEQFISLQHGNPFMSSSSSSSSRPSAATSAHDHGNNPLKAAATQFLRGVQEQQRHDEEEEERRDNPSSWSVPSSDDEEAATTPSSKAKPTTTTTTDDTHVLSDLEERETLVSRDTQWVRLLRGMVLVAVLLLGGTTAWVTFEVVQESDHHHHPHPRPADPDGVVSVQIYIYIHTLPHNGEC